MSKLAANEGRDAISFTRGYFDSLIPGLYWPLLRQLGRSTKMKSVSSFSS